MSSGLHHSVFKSPIGYIKISADDHFICELDFIDHDFTILKSELPVINECATQLNEYFAGKRKTFSLPLNPRGTEFQKRIWALLQKIPYGKTISYSELALKAGDINLTRAVGPANGANKIAIIIPCHRVIGSNGKLTGYAGGLWRKKWLLNLERRELQPELFFSPADSACLCRNGFVQAG